MACQLSFTLLHQTDDARLMMLPIDWRKEMFPPDSICQSHTMLVMCQVELH